MPRIAPRGITVLLAIAVLAYVLARFTSWQLALALALSAFAALVAFDAAVLLRGELQIERSVPPRLSLARRDAFTYEIVNRSNHERRVALVEAPAERLAIDLGEARAVLPPRTRASVTLGVLPRERGRTALRSFHARIRSPLGIVELRRAFRVPLALRVLPDLSALDRSGDLVARTKLIEAGLRRLRRRGSGGEFASLREYTPDDPFRSIDWKASARRGKPMVAQYEVERAQQIVVALDAGRLMSATTICCARSTSYCATIGLPRRAEAFQSIDRNGSSGVYSRRLANSPPLPRRRSRRRPASISLVRATRSPLRSSAERSGSTRSASGTRNARRSSTMPSGERMRAWNDRSAVRPRSGWRSILARRVRCFRRGRASPRSIASRSAGASTSAA